MITSLVISNKLTSHRSFLQTQRMQDEPMVSALPMLRDREMEAIKDQARYVFPAVCVTVPDRSR